jgi:hypothetical protein
MRWGNYDTVNAGSRFNSSEVPSSLGGAQAPYSNPVPGNNNLPPSFYYSTRPAWWTSTTKPWPPIGPDVGGGNISGVAGHAYTIPAEDCYLNTMNGATDGTAGPYKFNANTCYPAPLASAGDFDGDGHRDLIWQNDITRQVTVWYMGGAQGNTFQSWDWLSTGNTEGGPWLALRLQRRRTSGLNLAERHYAAGDSLVHGWRPRQHPPILGLAQHWKHRGMDRGWRCRLQR